MKKQKLLLSLLIFPLLACAQNAQWITRVRFHEFSGGVMLLTAKLEGVQDSLNFILDTGSGGASIDSTTAELYGIKSRRTDSTVVGLGSSRKVNFVFNKTLSIPGLNIENMNFHINDYSLLSSVYGVQIDGIIGYSFFRRYIAEILFEEGIINIYSPGKFTYKGKGHLFHPGFSTIPQQDVIMEDENIDNGLLYLDSGAGLCLLLTEQYADSVGLISKKRKPVFTQAEGMNDKVNIRLTAIKKLQFGPYTFKHVPVYLYNDNIRLFGQHGPVGLLGNEIMRRFNIVFNYPAREIYMVPNKRFGNPFDYSYTGLSIYVNESGIQVEDVVPLSPAYYAGLKMGDLVLGVGTNFTNDIIQYKDLLNVADQEILVTIRRHGELHQILLRTGNILNYGNYLEKARKKKSLGLEQPRNKRKN